MLRRITVRDGVWRSHLQNFPFRKAVKKRLLDLYSWVARGVSLAGGTVQKTLWPVLAAPKAIDLSQSPFSAVVPSYSLPLTSASVTCRAGEGGVDSGT